MKNLKLLTCINASIPKIETADVFLAIDSDAGRIYFNTATDIIGLDPGHDEEVFFISLKELGEGSEVVKVNGLQFLQGEESICVATQQGDLQVINVHTKLVENVGNVESGFVDMKWSPDQELLLLGTGHDTVLVMTREFDPVAELDIHAKEFGEGEFITVGWGKKETQFHGSEGKGAAVKMNESVASTTKWDDEKVRIVWRGDGQYFAVGLIDPVDGNRKFRVWNRECILQYTSENINGLESPLAWRPSGNLLASSQRKPHRHDIVFFEKNGLQHGEFTLPFGKDDMVVKNLEWNCDSSVLAIWMTSLGNSANEDSSDCVQLWTTSNYHWYLKQSMEFGEEESPVCVQWDNEHSHRLHILCKNGRYQQHNFGKVVNDSNLSVLFGEVEMNGHSKNDIHEKNNAFVAVIDGMEEAVTHGQMNHLVACQASSNMYCNLATKRRRTRNICSNCSIDVMSVAFYHSSGQDSVHDCNKKEENVNMTPFQTMTIPPPMCAYKLILPSEANSVSFMSSNQSSDVAVFMKNNEVAIFATREQKGVEETSISKLSVKLDAAGGNGFKSQVTPHEPVALLEIDIKDCEGVDLSALHHWIWLNSSQMFAISPGMLPGNDTAILFEINNEESKLKALKSVRIDGLVLSSHIHDSNLVVLQLQDGGLLKCNIPSLSIESYLLPSAETLKLPRPCNHVTSCSFSDETCIVGLSEHSRMYINDTEIASDCSSFCLHDDFLFLTTHSHKLRCISRTVSLKDVLKYFNTPIEGRSLLQDLDVIEMHRAIERGSKIVTVTPSDSRLVLQMPRGNLELIHPRCLVLSLVRRYIKSLSYGEAFTVMKKHRINMNLLCDVNKQLFLKNVDKFVMQLSSTSNINIFIGDLRDENFSNTMYKQYFGSMDTETSSSVTASPSSKLNEVCDALIEEMEKNEEKYIMSLVTAHVKKHPSEVSLALRRIKKLSDSKSHEEKLIGDVLKYMTVLIDDNALFNEALGTYDFKLVLMVAEKSQLDPKEFLPMLHELQKLEENYRKYKIDLKLRKFSSALEHISKCDDHFDECMELIEKHEMFRTALKLFDEKSEKYKTICESYGSYLNGKHKYQEAGVVFLRCHNFVKALEAFSNSDSYSLALSTAYKLKLQKSEIVELAYKLAEKAKTKGRHLEAVELLEHHACDIEVAMETALDARLWQIAIRITEQYQRTDLVETHILPSIKEVSDQFYQSLQSYKETIVNQSTRLDIVRQLKEKQRMQALMDGVDGIGMDSDLYSDTSSTMAGSITSRPSSTASRSTGRTSKSRKKRERRSYSLKEGSKFEDLALMHSLKNTIKVVDEMSDDVRSLCLHLSLLSLDHLGEKLQALYADVRDVIAGVIPTIWSQSMLQTDQMTTGPQSTVNSIVASMQNRRTNTGQSENLNEKQNFEDLNLFVPPKFHNSTSWMVNVYEKV